MANSVPLRFLAFLTFLLSAQAAHVEATRDPNQLAHELFAPSANAIAVNASVSGPANAIAIFSGADKDIRTGSKSGVVLSTGDATSGQPLGGQESSGSSSPRPSPSKGVGEEVGARDDQLSQLTGGKSSGGATLSCQFQTTGDTKSFRINFAFVTQESASRIQQGFDDVFAVFIDGELAEFTRASESREPPDQKKNSSLAAKNLRVITRSKIIELSPDKVHSIKLAIADVGDNSGDSLAFISITGNDDLDPFIASPLLALLPPQPPEDLTSIKGPPKTAPPTTTPPPPPLWPPVTPLSGPTPFERKPPVHQAAPPPPPYIEREPPPVSVPDQSSSITLLAVGMILLLALRNSYIIKSLSLFDLCKNSRHPDRV